MPREKGEPRNANIHMSIRVSKEERAKLNRTAKNRGYKSTSQMILQRTLWNPINLTKLQHEQLAAKAQAEGTTVEKLIMTLIKN